MKYFKFLFFGLICLMVGETIGQNDLVLSADSLYNLGNSAYANEQYDQAIYYYEKAKLLDPGAMDIATNLKLTKEQLSTDIIEIKPFFLVVWWETFYGQLLPGGWKITSLLLLVVLLFLMYFYWFKNKPEKKNIFYTVFGVLALLFLLTIFAGKSRANKIFNSSEAVVFGGDKSLYLGPDVVSEQIKRLTGGNKLRILDEDGDWYNVSAMDSEQGWIMKKDVKLIRFEQ